MSLHTRVFELGARWPLHSCILRPTLDMVGGVKTKLSTDKFVQQGCNPSEKLGGCALAGVFKRLVGVVMFLVGVFNLLVGVFKLWLAFSNCWLTCSKFLVRRVPKVVAN